MNLHGYKMVDYALLGIDRGSKRSLNSSAHVQLVH